MANLIKTRWIASILVTVFVSVQCAISEVITNSDGIQAQERLLGSEDNHIAGDASFRLCPSSVTGAQHEEYACTKLNFSSSAPHLFHSTFSLLQQLSNTVFPNGHTIAPVEIPPLTLFYHARRDADVPSSPEWVAFDSEMSYGMMGGHRNVWMRTYQSTRPIRALYFDGLSGSLQGLGQFDTQMLLLHGNVTGAPNETRNDLELEYVRAEGLCNWLQDAGLRSNSSSSPSSPGFDGIVRMNAGFEMIWCDFENDGLRLISSINVTAPQLPTKSESSGKKGTWTRRDPGPINGEANASEPPPAPTPKLPDMPPGWKDELRREPFIRTRSWGWFESASWHYGSFGSRSTAGETRARLLSCGVLSYYSSSFESLALSRAREERQRLNLTDSGLWMGPGPDGDIAEALLLLRRRRRFHHLGYASPADAGAMTTDMQDTLRMVLREEGRCSLADWALITSEIIQRVSGILQAQDFVWSRPPKDWDHESTVRRWLHVARGRSHLFLVNFLQYPETDDLSVWSSGSKLFNNTVGLCQHRYTTLIREEDAPTSMPYELELARAVEETFAAICQVQCEIGFDIERAWREADYNSGPSMADDEIATSTVPCRLRQRARAWRDQLDELVAWLGWENEHLGCKEVCAADERCYIPMWPITRPEKQASASRPQGSRASRTLRRPWVHTDETDLWEPKCVKDVCIEGICDL